MTNIVALSGKLLECYDMTENIVLGILECNDDKYHIFWESDNFQEDLKGEYICVQGYLQYIKFRKPGNENITRVLAICVERMEMYDI